jgi:hypothetical protein
VIVKIESPGTTHQTICTIGRLLVLAGAIWKGRLEIKEMLNLGLRKYFEATVIFVFNLFQSFFFTFKQGSALLENCLSCSFCLCIYIINILRILDLEVQSAVLAIASIIGWGYVLFFVMAFRLTGPFVVMIYQMLFNDVLRFCIIYVVFLVGFSQSFFVLFDYNGKQSNNKFKKI